MYMQPIPKYHITAEYFERPVEICLFKITGLGYIFSPWHFLDFADSPTECLWLNSLQWHRKTFLSQKSMSDFVNFFMCTFSSKVILWPLKLYFFFHGFKQVPYHFIISLLWDVNPHWWYLLRFEATLGL